MAFIVLSGFSLALSPARLNWLLDSAFRFAGLPAPLWVNRRRWPLASLVGSDH